MTLDELKKLEAAATPGPWTHCSGQDVRAFYPHHSHRMALASTDANAAFIAAMRNAAPKLIAVAEAAQEVNEADRIGDLEKGREAALYKLHKALSALASESARE